ncbi:hypothetical protein MCEMIH15_01911 [Caulobacteraceae bacterium]
MFTLRFWAGFLCGSILAAGGFGWMLSKIQIKTDIVFPDKTISVSNDYVGFFGSIVDKEEKLPNGTTLGECDRQSGICRFYTIDQIGDMHMSPIRPFTLRIRQWDDGIIRADTKGYNSKQCYYFEIRIDRATEEISYTRFRQNSDCPFADGEPDITKWKIDDPYSRTRLSE